MRARTGLSAVVVEQDGEEDGPGARFEALFEAHHAAVLAYARRRAPDDLAADVASAAFEVLWRRIDDLPADARPWLYGVARGLLANRRRGDARRVRLVDRLSRRSGPASPGPSPDAADAAIDGAAARAALARLRPDDRELLMLVAWEGMAADQAASVLGITESTFAVRLHRARRRLEDQLRSTKGST
jgi:RNA polymerase sigma-70 factor (ECF subfamily)